MPRAFLVLTFLFASAAFGQDIPPFSFDTLLEIGSDEDADENYLFGRIKGIAVDSAGHIVVADEMSMLLMVYDASGNYVRSLGSRGAGPGEFQALTSMTINRDNHIIVMDGRLSRITILDLDGQVVNTVQIDRSELIWPRALNQHTETGEYYILSKMPEHPARSAEDVDRLVHVYDAEFEKKRDRLASYTEMETYDDDEFARIRLHEYPGSIEVTSDGEILLALGLYNGLIYKYAQKGDEWLLTEQYNGFAAPIDIYKRVDSKSAMKRGFALTKRVVDKKVVEIAGYSNVLSAGLFHLSNGGIVHFVNVNDDDEGFLYMETYDMYGTMTSLEKLQENLPRSGGRDPIVRVFWRDNADRYYLVDYSQDYPILKVVSVK